MAAFTASVTGNWADTATWGGSGPPGDGDTVVIANAITLTIPVSTSVTIGASPDDDVSTPAIESAGTGTLTINGDLIFKGTVKQSSDWNIGPGVAITHDSSAATTPSTANYSWQIGVLNGLTDTLITRGTTGSGRVRFINAGSSGKFAGFTRGSLTTGGGNVDFEFTSVTGARDPNLAQFQCIQTDMRYADSIQRLDHCLFSDCGPIGNLSGTNMNVDSTFQHNFTSHLAPSDTRSYYGWENSSADVSVSGVREMTDCAYEGSVEIIYARSINFDGTAVWGPSTAKVVNGLGGIRFDCASWQNALIVNGFTVGASIVGRGKVTGVLGMNNTTATEYDFMRGGSVNAFDVYDFDGCVLIAHQANSGGEFFLGEGSPGVPVTLRVVNNLALPADTDGGNSGHLSTAVTTSANFSWLTENNTQALTSSIAGVAPYLMQTEALVPAGKITTRNNLLSNSGVTARTGYQTYNGTPLLTDPAFVVADYNCTWRLSAGPYNHPDSDFQTTPPGQNDVDVDPQFVDDSFGLTAWASGIDASITSMQDWWDNVKHINDEASSYNPELYWMNFHAAARVAFTPTNELLRGAGFDGSDIGAVPMNTGRIMGAIAGNGGLAGIGGLAGQSGGLAG